MCQPFLWVSMPLEMLLSQVDEELLEDDVAACLLQLLPVAGRVKARNIPTPVLLNFEPPRPNSAKALADLLLDSGCTVSAYLSL